MNNLSDKAPPIAGRALEPSNNGNTFLGMYAALGRYSFVRGSVGFS